MLPFSHFLTQESKCVINSGFLLLLDALGNILERIYDTGHVRSLSLPKLVLRIQITSLRRSELSCRLSCLFRCNPSIICWCSGFKADERWRGSNSYCCSSFGSEVSLPCVVATIWHQYATLMSHSFNYFKVGLFRSGGSRFFVDLES